METLSAILQIGILYLTIYAGLKRARGSRLGQALMGIGLLITALVAFTYLFHFQVLAYIINYLLVYLAFSSVIIFQPEIRRVLTAFGTFGQDRTHRSDGAITPEAFTDVLADLASRRIGALFAVERGISLRGYEDTGIRTDAVITRELIVSVFTPPLPLHDGGAVVRNGRLSSAHCIFPLSNTPELIRNGMRHRAAVGLSEETDALVIVVSEERGTISVAHNGNLYRYDLASASARKSLLRWVRKAFGDESSRRSWYQPLVTSVQNLLFKPITPDKDDPAK